MIQFKKAAIVTMIVLFAAAKGFAQDAKVMVVDLERAVVTSVEGKKGQDQFNSKLEERRAAVAKLQKDLSDNQNKLQTQQRALSETAVAELNRTITKQDTDLKRMSEDAQKELDDLRQQLLQPLMEVAQRVVQIYAQDKGYSAVFDISSPTSNVAWFNPNNDITDEVIKGINAATTSAAPAAPATPAKAATPGK